MNMTRKEIEEMNDTRPSCFETDREEQWFNIGLQYGLDVADSDPKSPWISTDDDLPCNHPEMCYEVSVKGYMFTDIVLVHTKDNSIFTCNMKKGPDGSFIWNVLPKSIVITHWAKYPNLIDMMLNK